VLDRLKVLSEKLTRHPFEVGRVKEFGHPTVDDAERFKLRSLLSKRFQLSKQSVLLLSPLF
jgi:hypothetical protein